MNKARLVSLGAVYIYIYIYIGNLLKRLNNIDIKITAKPKSI